MKKLSLSDIVVPVGLALLVIWGTQYFFSKRDSTPVNAWTFIAPQQGSSVKPINTHVDFLEENKKTPLTTTIDTAWGMCEFSTQGGTLSSLAFKKGSGKNTHRIYTVISSENQEDQFFLVGLNTATPYYYEFLGKQDAGTEYHVSYRAMSKECSIEKLFRIEKHRSVIYCDLTITPLTDHVVQPRLFFSSPVMPGISGDQISAVVVDGDNHYAKIARNGIKDSFGWIEPKLFGADNKYYIHALINDAHNFVSRAYYKFVQKENLIAVLEGPEVNKKMTWSLAFYCGPKDSDVMQTVDPRLVPAARNDGWLAPLVNILLFLLKWFYSYSRNYGWAIILLTVLIKLILFPFTFRGERSMQKSQETSKKLAYIEQKYKNDPERLNQERAEFIRKHGLPGLSGCLPVLLQLPVFFALNRLLYQAPEMYKESFLWIADLSAVDPWYILPLIMFMGMVINALMVPANQRVNMLMLAVMFGAVSANFSAGLALYMVVSTVLGLVQARLVKIIG